MGTEERMRDMISGVKPLSVRLMMALTPGKWLAVYMAARAMLSSQRSKVWPMRWLDFLVVGCFSTTAQMRDMALTASTWYSPAADSAESITASLWSITALATTETSTRIGIGLWI